MRYEIVTVSVICTLSPTADSVAVDESNVWNRIVPVFDVVIVVFGHDVKMPTFATVCGSVSEPFAVNVNEIVYVFVALVCAYAARRRRRPPPLKNNSLTVEPSFVRKRSV